VETFKSYGNLAEEGCVAKLVVTKENISKVTIVYENEHDVITGVRGGEVKPGNVVVIRYCGPKVEGMPEMLKPTSAIMGAGLGKV
jgi:dihydroxy-acid dehydratase